MACKITRGLQVATEKLAQVICLVVVDLKSDLLQSQVARELDIHAMIIQHSLQGYSLQLTIQLVCDIIHQMVVALLHWRA